MYAKLHNFFLNKFLEGSKEILKKLKDGQWTIPEFEIEHFPEISRTSLPHFFLLWIAIVGVYNRLIDISPPNFWSRIWVFNNTRSTSRCFYSRRWCFINEGVASCYDFVVPGHSMLIECADCEKIEVHVPFVGKHFLAL